MYVDSSSECNILKFDIGTENDSVTRQWSIKVSFTTLHEISEFLLFLTFNIIWSVITNFHLNRVTKHNKLMSNSFKKDKDPSIFNPICI